MVSDHVVKTPPSEISAASLLVKRPGLFCGSDRGGQSAALLYTLVQTVRLNNVDPQAWRADVLARIADHSATRLDEFLPWIWGLPQAALAA